MKLVLKIASIGALGLLLLVVALSLVMNPLLAGALRSGVTRATGTPTSLASVDLALVSGRLDLSGLAIANPEGFRDEPFLALEHGRVDVAAASLFGDTVDVRSIELSGVVLNVEAEGLSTNYGALLEHMRRAPDGAGGSPDTSTDGASTDGARKTLAVERIVVTDIRCALHLDVPLAGGSGALLIPRVEIRDFQSDGSTAHNVAKLTRALVEALLGAVLEEGGSLLPGPLLGSLQDELAGLRRTLEQNPRDIEGVGRAVEEVGGALKKLLGKQDQ